MRPSNALPAVYLCRDIVDFRKGINGLAVLVEEALQHDPFSEQLFVFCNRQDQDPVLGAQRLLFVAEASGTGTFPMAAQGWQYCDHAERTATELAAGWL